MLTLKGNFFSSHQMNIAENIAFDEYDVATDYAVQNLSGPDAATDPDDNHATRATRIKGMITAIWEKIKNLFDGHITEAHAEKHLKGLVRARFLHPHTAANEQSQQQIDALNHFLALHELSGPGSKANFKKIYHPDRNVMTLQILSDDGVNSAFEFSFTPTPAYVRQDIRIQHARWGNLQTYFAKDKATAAENIFFEIGKPGRTIEQDIASLVQLKNLAFNNNRNRFQIDVTAPDQNSINGTVSVGIKIDGITFRKEVCEYQSLAQNLSRTGRHSSTELLFETFSKIPQFQVSLKNSVTPGQIDFTLLINNQEILVKTEVDASEILRTISRFQIDPKCVLNGDVELKTEQPVSPAPISDFIKNYKRACLHNGGWPLTRKTVIKLIQIHADLSYLDLSNLNLSDIEFGLSKLNGTNLSNTNLRNSILKDATLCDADLSDADLRDADLSDANLDGANLTKADLRKAHLENVQLRNAKLCRADCREADLTNAKMQGADARHTDLRLANISGANLFQIRHTGCKTAGAIVTDLILPPYQFIRSSNIPKEQWLLNHFKAAIHLFRSRQTMNIVERDIEKDRNRTTQTYLHDASTNTAISVTAKPEHQQTVLEKNIRNCLISQNYRGFFMVLSASLMTAGFKAVIDGENTFPDFDKNSTYRFAIAEPFAETRSIVVAYTYYCAEKELSVDISAKLTLTQEFAEKLNDESYLKNSGDGIENIEILTFASSNIPLIEEDNP